jgi:hypothetical protein
VSPEHPRSKWSDQVDHKKYELFFFFHYMYTMTTNYVHVTLSNGIPAEARASSKFGGSNYNTMYGVDKAFDSKVNTFWGSNGNPPHWLELKFQQPMRIYNYTIDTTGFSSGSIIFRPKKWQFQGSNDLHYWTVLHSVENASGSSNTYHIPSHYQSQYWKYVRILILQPQQVFIGEFNVLAEQQPHPQPPPPAHPQPPPPAHQTTNPIHVTLSDGTPAEASASSSYTGGGVWIG